MKNSIFLFLMVISISSCKNEDFDYEAFSRPDNSIGEAIVYKNCFIDGFEKSTVIDTFISNNDTFIENRYVTTFDMHIDFLKLKNSDLLSSHPTPKLLYSSTYYFIPNNQVEIDTNQQNGGINITTYPNNKASSDYTNLIMLDCERDANALFLTSFGFFLDQYLEDSLAGYDRDPIVGFYKNANNTLEMETNKSQAMVTFFKKISGASKDIYQPFDIVPANQLLLEIQLGAEELTQLPLTKDSLHLTIVTSTLFDSTNIDSSLYNSVQMQLKTANIKLNIISLLPLDFMQPMVFKSRGFIVNDIEQVNDINFFSAQPYEFERLYVEKSFSSRHAFQNFDKIANNEMSGSVNRLTLNYSSSTNQNTPTNNFKDLLRNQYFQIQFEENNVLPIVLYFKPDIK